MNPMANAMSSPTPGSFSRTTASPTYAPAMSVSSSAAICARRSSAISRCGDVGAIDVVRRLSHVNPAASAPKATTVVRNASLIYEAGASLRRKPLHGPRPPLRRLASRGALASLADVASSQPLSRLQELERVYVVAGGIDRRGHTVLMGRIVADGLPQITVRRQVEPLARGVEQYAHARA